MLLYFPSFSFWSFSLERNLALAISRSEASKIVNMVPKGQFFTGKALIALSVRIRSGVSPLIQADGEALMTKGSNPIGGARLFCQALFGTFWGAKKYGRYGNTAKIGTIPYAECCLGTTCLLSNNLGDKKHIVQCNLMRIYSQLKTGKL